MDRDLVALLRALALLRWLAVAGQTLAVWAATGPLGLHLDARPLYAGPLLLAGFAVWASLRARRLARVSPGEVLAHVAVDLAVLTWMLYWSGGPANPFVSLYLLPIALVAFALPPRVVLAVAVAAASGYTLLMLRHVPIPHHHGDAAFFDLHLVGMWVNFLLTAALVTVFATRLAALISSQRRALARAREDALRNEGILAVATQAAATAHALNTPLSTMAVVLADLVDVHGDTPELGVDLRTLRGQVDACRDAVRRLAVDAEPASRTPVSLQQLVRRALERLQVLRPDARPDVTGLDALDGVRVLDDARLEHLLLNLLNNAFDASVAAGGSGATLAVSVDGEAVAITVRDRGPGLSALPSDFSSDKPDGLGLGLTLARVIVEHFHGRISTHVIDGTGAVRVDLPLAHLVAR
jgi:two-component system sensor histidine kinase RegB